MPNGKKAHNFGNVHVILDLIVMKIITRADFIYSALASCHKNAGSLTDKVALEKSSAVVIEVRQISIHNRNFAKRLFSIHNRTFRRRLQRYHIFFTMLAIGQRL